MGNPTTRCLEAEVLAAYLDHGLSLAERARVDAHLASCPQCLALVAGVARTVAALPADLPGVASAAASTSLLTRRTLARWALAAAAVLAVVAVPSLVRSLVDHDMGLVSLADTVGQSRSVLGRLTGGFPHTPLGGPSAGGQDGQAAENRRVLLTAGKTRESFGERLTPSRLHADGLTQLLGGQLDEAVASLAAASREQPANAAYLNDLAVAQLERARLGVRPDDLPRALAATTRAYHLDPSSPETLFNRALALTSLSLRDQAIAAWSEYLARDGASPWAAEARTRLDELRRPTRAEEWASVQGRLQQAPVTSASAEETVRIHVSNTRRYIDNVLMVQWATAVTNGSNAGPALAVVRTFAEAMEHVTGDAFYTYETGLLDRLSPVEAQRYARAYIQFASAYRLFEQDALAQAASTARGAQNDLRALGSNYALLGDIVIAAASYYSADYVTAESLLSAAQAAADARHLWFVVGRASWLRGMIAFTQGRLEDTQIHYERTLSTFERLGDTEHAATTHSLLAGLYFTLGDRGSEWRHHQLALASFGSMDSERARYLILIAASASLRIDNPEAALVVQDAALASAIASGRNTAIAEALAQKASSLVALGRLTEAASTVSQARKNLDQFTDPSMRRLLELPILAVESDLLRPRDPAAAAATAQRGLDVLRQRNSPAERRRVAQLSLRLAKAGIAQGRLDDATRALNEGLRAFDDERANLKSDTALSAYDDAWQLFDQAMRIALRKHEYAKALALDERGRRRLPYRGSLPNDPDGLGALQARLAQGEALIATNQFDDELALWAITKQHVRVILRPLSRLDSQRLIMRQATELGYASALDASANLYDQVVRPLEDELDGATRITVVPDATFENASFAAMYDRRQSRFLVEQAVLTSAPSVAAVMVPSVSAPENPNSVLVLASKADMAPDIARVYASAATVQGPAAHPKALLETRPSAAVIHLAADVVPNGAYPALAAAQLSDEPGRLYSGRLMAKDIATHQFKDTRVVVIEEVAATGRHRGEGTLSVASAFLAAGVPAVVGTLPGADEGAVRDLMIGFHREIAAGVPAAQALAQVQRNAIQQNGRRSGAWSALVLYGSDR